MMQTIDLGYLDQQLDMVAMYSRDRRISRAELVSVFAGLPEVSVFALLDAVSQRNVRRALALLRRQLADGTYFTVILVLLTRHVRQLWQAQVLQAKGIRGKALAKQLELNPYHNFVEWVGYCLILTALFSLLYLSCLLLLTEGARNMVRRVLRR